MSPSCFFTQCAAASSRSLVFNELTLHIHRRFRQQGIMSDLDEAIELNCAALLLCPPRNSDRSMSLNNLANSLMDRFEQRDIMSDIDEAIELHRAALVLHPPGHSDQSISLNNLALCLQHRFEQRDIISDLDEAIELHQAALLLHPSDRFLQRGIMSDLDEAIELHHEALLLLPPGHLDRSISLNNLANSLAARFRQWGIMSDLDEAIELHCAALLLRPPSHSDRWMSLNNLADGLLQRFGQWGIMSDIDLAIDLYHRSSLRDRFLQWGIMPDLDEAIELYHAALVLYLLGHSERSSSLRNLALSLQDRFREWGVQSDYDEAFSLYSQLSHLSHAASPTHLDAAKSWAASAYVLNHPSALLAYQVALKFLDQRVALLSSSSHHFNVVREAVSSLATDAFLCSVRHGELTTAVELVEQGHAVFWTQLACFSTPLDELSHSGDIGKALAEEFKRLSFYLHNAFDQSTEDQFPQIRQLTMQWDDVVAHIRMLPDFPRFLLPPLFSDLQKAAEDGPVIVVNASQYGCDALIVHNAEDPVHVPLDITQAEVSELSSNFHKLAEQFGSSDNQLKLVGVLRKLWNDVVDPIVQALRESNVCPGSHIWWCPTVEFTLLPLHAAGPYELKKKNMSDIYISSYTPTLTTLIPNPAHGRELKCVASELAAVAEHVPPTVSFTSLEGAEATVKNALDALNHNQWLHLACHGMPNQTQPFDSSFAMRNGPLMIKDIIRSNWQNPQFAFLSACHTTVGDEKRPDESIHLAAAMQFCGFFSVIGSMWSVEDEVARQVVSTFYQNLIDDSKRLDCTRAAVALHTSVNW
ncbi:CHAT domain-containing protein [Suillus discolor]|uniref:CHAT domain-containing protein n=1 Tax=Suillus discolor TaxID=1912936 RepID=A0A9P7ETF5_9AGAM|nr:CHAT domain-containing protein [Suillus discolor]KAG2090111.1 CHAT domain-containing protein [Suillus discolor]